MVTVARKALSQLLNESLYVGIDIGKFEHVAGFLSATLLKRHERFESGFCLHYSRSGATEGHAQI